MVEDGRHAPSHDSPSARVTLREVVEEDLPAFFEHQREPEANRMAAFPPRERDAFFAHWAKVLKDPAVVVRTVLLDGEVAGNIVCWGPPEERDVGYWIAKEHWGKGGASEALRQFLAVVKERPLFAHVAKHNGGSIRVLEKCGFVFAGEAVVPYGPGGPDVAEHLMRLDGRGGGAEEMLNGECGKSNMKEKSEKRRAKSESGGRVT